MIGFKYSIIENGITITGTIIEYNVKYNEYIVLWTDGKTTTENEHDIFAKLSSEIDKRGV